MMLLALSDTQKQMKTYQKVTSYILLIGMLSFLSGFFWQASYSRLHTVYFILVVLPALILFPLFIKEQLHKNKLFVLILLFCFYSLLSVFWGETFQVDLLVTYLKRMLVLIILFYAIYHIILHYPSIEKVIFVLLMISGFGLATYSIFEYSQGDLSRRLYLWGGLNDAISSAIVYGVLFLLAARAYLCEKNKYLLVIYFLLACLFLVEILLTKSRGPLLALILSIPLIFLVVKPLDYKRVFYPLLFIAISVLAIFVFTDFSDRFLSRDFNLSYRDVIWRDSINLSLESPWFGYGLGSQFEFILPGTERTKWLEETVSHSHNIILSTWLYTGVIGVGLFIVIVYTAVKICFNHKQETFSILAVVIIFGMLCLLTNGSYPISRANERWFVFWIPLAFIVAHSLSYSEYNRRK